MEGQDTTQTKPDPSSRARATTARSVEGKVDETIAKEQKTKKLCVVIKKKKSNIKIKTGMIKVKPNRGPGSVVVVAASPAARRNVITTTDNKRSIAAASSKRRTFGNVICGGGLPSKTKTTIRTSEDNADNHDSNNDDDDEFGLGCGGMDSFVLPSDTYVAIQSLQEGSQGLHIPCNSPMQSLMIQAVLESQIYSRFDDDHVSTIYQELHELYANKQIKALVCWGVGSSNANSTATTSTAHRSNPTQQQRRRRLAIVTTSDYISGIWMAHESFLHTNNASTDSSSGSRPAYQQPLPHDAYHKITEWFTFHLKSTWTEPAVLSKRDLKSKWEDLILSHDSYAAPNSSSSSATSDHNQGRNVIIVTLSHALYYLQVQLQVLMRDGSPLASSTIDDDNEMYHLWLPQWGIVLKAWTTAQQQVLSQIKRSRGGIIGATTAGTGSVDTKQRRSGEISEQNLLHTNRHANISTKFLLDDLLSQGVIRRIQRPFGTFIRLE